MLATLRPAAGRGMNRRIRDLERLLAMIALQNAARPVEIRKTSGGHIRASFDRGSALFISSTPSDVRSIKNTAAMARRGLRRMTAA
jgi:hypothetical protein